MRDREFILSLSLGSGGVSSGLAVVEPKPVARKSEKEESTPGHDETVTFEVIWLERFGAERRYPAIIGRVAEIVAARQLGQRYSLLVDITATGRPPLKMFEDRGQYPHALQVVAGTEETYVSGVQSVPRRDMVSVAQLLLQSNKLLVAADLEFARDLVADLQAFDPQPPPARQAPHRNEDLVRAVAIAVWWGDRQTWNLDMSKINPLAGGRSRGAYSWLGV